MQTKCVGQTRFIVNFQPFSIVSSSKSLVLAGRIEDEPQKLVYMSNGSLDQIFQKCKTTKTHVGSREPQQHNK